MKPPRHDDDICLAHNTPLRIPAPHGVQVTCTAGVLWLTVEGESGDVLLRAGNSHLIRADGLALVEAIGHGRARLERMRLSPVARAQAWLSECSRRLAVVGWLASNNAARASFASLQRAAAD